MSKQKQTSALDYEKLGFKSGLELHAQLITEHKLFCPCKAELRTDDPDGHYIRRFRPVLGELGEYDRAMLIEFEKGHTIHYEVYKQLCTYELDETE